jgi:spore maturation protein CgeB
MDKNTRGSKMKILHADGLHGGEWTTFRKQALEDLQVHGRITDLLPKNHNGGWIWDQVLSQMGHEVIQFDYRSSFLINKEILIRWSGLKESYDTVVSRCPWLSRIDQKKMNIALLALAKQEKPDIFLTFLGERIYPETIAALGKMNITTVLWFERNFIFEKTPNVVESIPYYDFVFTHDPGFIKTLKDLGARQIHYLPFGCYPPLHRKIPKDSFDYHKYRAEVAFVGTLMSGRVRFLHQILDTGVNFWTHEWDEAMARCYPELIPRYRGEARGEPMLYVLNASDIILNPHHQTNSITGTNMRTFECAACEAFQLAEAKPEINRFFRVGEEIEVYYDIDDLKKKIKYYLKHPDEREEMAKKAQKKVYAEHTYQHRFKEMLEIIGA